MRWGALSKEISQDGAPGVEYQRFVARWNDPNDKVMQQIKQAKLIKKFDKDGVVINTGKQRELDNQTDPEVQADNGSDVLDSTAKQAAKRAMKA
jgi:hypothetical protein